MNLTTASEWILRSALSLRYRIKFQGLEDLLKTEKKGGLLFLPNHTSRIDPLLLIMFFSSRFRLRPLVVEYIYQLPFLRPLMNFIRAIPIPNFETSVNGFKVNKAKESFDLVAEGLNRGENFLLYPSGRLKKESKEIVGGASGAYDLVNRCPDASVILIRITGLWGSSFSRAHSQEPPDLWHAIKNGVKAVLKNLLLFTPRREVLIEIETKPEGLPRKEGRIAFNRFLENWYNRYPDGKGNVVHEEPLQLISYSRWRKDCPKIVSETKKSLSELSVSPGTTRMIYQEITRILNNPSLEIQPSMRFSEDLGMDSLNLAELFAFLIRHFKVKNSQLQEVVTVQDALQATVMPKDESIDSKRPVPIQWVQEKDLPDPVLAVGRTMPEALLHICSKRGSSIAYADDFTGVWTYNRFKKAVIALAEHLKTVEGQYVAVLLPSSVAAYLLIFAIQFAGKIPVMLNWTLGERYIDQMMEQSKATIILTSWNFLERLNYVEFGRHVKKIQLLEEIRRNLPLRAKLKTLLPSRFHFNPSRLDENTPAVLLFTSGTEAEPKGVPLSHRNILENQRSLFKGFPFVNQDSNLNTLPPFHSLGFSIGGIFPLLGGIRTAFFPDPTNSLALADRIEKWSPTLISSPPTFLKNLFSISGNRQFPSLRVIVSAGEKTPPELFEQMRQIAPNAQLIIAYGATECAPCVTVTEMDSPPKGVGKVLPGVEVRTIHPETSTPLPRGTEGEICVCGQNVFGGYFNKTSDPFVEIEKKRWYRTGDLGFLDEDGNLILSGRLKRFVKIGGEMISLAAIEEAILKELIRQGRAVSDIPNVAICVENGEHGVPQLILFTTAVMNTLETNRLLKDAGFSNLIKISAVHSLAEIPRLATGKTDYRGLNALLKSKSTH